jgi:hypothetical protein
MACDLMPDGPRKRAVPTIRIDTITHAQAIRLPGDRANSVQIDGLDENGRVIRVILAPTVVDAMLARAALEAA